MITPPSRSWPGCEAGPHQCRAGWGRTYTGRYQGRTVKGKSRFSREVSSSSSESGQARPARSARSTQFLIVPQATPQLCAACLADKPLPQQRRKISLIFLMDNLVFAIAAPCCFGRSVPRHLCDFIQRLLLLLRGGQIHHNRRPIWVIMGGQFGSEYAVIEVPTCFFKSMGTIVPSGFS
jgi:hypothetical protein